MLPAKETLGNSHVVSDRPEVLYLFIGGYRNHCGTMCYQQRKHYAARTWCLTDQKCYISSLVAIGITVVLCVISKGNIRQLTHGV